jgi:tol-pal system protein YbgF
MIGAAGVFLLLAFSAPAASDQKERDAQLKLALDQLRAEIVVLERQVRSMQEAQDRNTGQLNALVTQIIDNVTAIRQAQSRVSESSVSALGAVGALGERLSATNQQIEALSGQLAELKKMVENLPKLPAFTQITPGNPDQLFAAAIGDYYRGNYELALSEFRQYVETYPSSEMADNAQYWIGEIHLAKKQPTEAIVEFDKVIVQFPKGDKVPTARYKKARALLDLGQTDAAKAEFRELIKLFPRSNEAALSRQELGER